MLKGLIKLLKALNANQRPGELAAGIALGWWMALMPAGSGLWWMIFVLSFFLKINSTAQFLFLGLFNLFTFVLDPLLHNLGYYVLTEPSLVSFWNSLWNTPGLALLGFQNTLVTGGFLAGAVLFLPLLLLTRVLVIFYRKRLRETIVNSRFVKGLLKLPLIKSLHVAYDRAGGIMNRL